MLIGLCGKAGAGKSSVAKWMPDPKKICSFAAPLKRIAAEYFGWDRKKDERGRKLLQTLGTDVGRQYNPDIWVDHAKKTYEANLNECEGDYSLIIFDDVRFINEAEFIRDYEGILIQVEDPEAETCGIHGEERRIKEACDKHISEAGIPKDLIDHTLTNVMGSQINTMAKLGKILQDYGVTTQLGLVRTYE